MRRWAVLAGLVLGGCVTESLSVCINCGGFSVIDLQGGYRIALTAQRGAALPCADLQVRMTTPITWDGCLSPQGGAADADRGVIRLTFVDSTGTAGALEFFAVYGSADSAQAFWRSSCNKSAPSDTDCPVGEGTARWSRSATAGTRDRASALPRRP